MPPSSSNTLAINGEKEENTAVAPALLEANSDLECAEGGAFFSGTAEAARSSSTISGRGKCDVNPGLAPDGAAVAPAPVHIVSRLRGGARTTSPTSKTAAASPAPLLRVGTLLSSPPVALRPDSRVWVAPLLQPPLLQQLQ